MILAGNKSQFDILSLQKRVMLIAAALLLLGCSKVLDNDDIVVFQGSTMGTTYSIKVAGFPESVDLEQIQGEIEALLVRVNQSMSTYIPDSEISRINRSDGTAPIPVSSMMFDVLTESLRISVLSKGALDMTVAPLVNLWGFGADPKTTAIPDDQKIKSLLKQTGYKKIRVTGTPLTISKSHPKLTIDLSAIAKGYAVDQVSLLLESKGLANYLVEIGGEIRTNGFKIDQAPWIVGIERPVSGERVIQQVISIGNRSMATSGDYRNYFEENGKRFSHLIDPNSGRPIEHKLVSASVVHQSCMTADGFATAFMVMGTGSAYELATKQNLAVYFLVKTESGFEVKTTPAFDAFLVKN